jgi:hypothetical protein
MNYRLCRAERIEAVTAALRERLRQMFNDEAKRKSFRGTPRKIRCGQIPQSLADHHNGTVPRRDTWSWALSLMAL